MYWANRSLENKAMDHMDHALGRRIDPMGAGYRNYFATRKGDENDIAFSASDHWEVSRRSEDMIWHRVTDAGRKALKAHLKEIGDTWRAFIVTWKNQETWEIGTSHSNAKYRAWMELSDSLGDDLSFIDFCKDARVRLAT